MARKSRKQMFRNYSHVIVQGIEKSYIFGERRFKELYLALLEKYLEEFEIEILAYCIMDNHAHILLYSDKEEELTNFMHKVNTSFAIKYNRLKNRVGYVFRDRYFLQPIKGERQLYNCLVYIHKNPISANMVKEYGEYDFSSYKEFLGKQILLTDKGIKLIFGSSNNYLETFEKIHQDRIIEDIKDVQEYVSEYVVIDDFIKLSGKNFDEIKSDRHLLKKLLIRLRKESGISFRRLELIFKISRITLKNIVEE